MIPDGNLDLHRMKRHTGIVNVYVAEYKAFIFKKSLKDIFMRQKSRT